MNLVWTPKSGNTGPVLLCSDAVAQLLIAKGSAIDLDKSEKPIILEVEAKAAEVIVKQVPKKKVQTKKKIKK